MLCNFWVMWATKLSEAGNCVLLTNLESKNWTTRQALNDGQVLWQDSLVDIVKLFSNWSRKVEQFHGWDFETSSQDHVDDLAGTSFSQHMWLNQAESAVIEDSSCLHGSRWGLVTSEPVIDFSLVCSWGVSAMDSILCSVSTKLCPDWSGCFLLCTPSVGWSNDFSPFFHSIWRYKFHSNDYITTDMSF